MLLQTFFLINSSVLTPFLGFLLAVPILYYVLHMLKKMLIILIQIENGIAIRIAKLCGGLQKIQNSQKIAKIVAMILSLSCLLYWCSIVWDTREFMYPTNSEDYSRTFIKFILVERYRWLPYFAGPAEGSFAVGLDSISIAFITLTLALAPLVILVAFQSISFLLTEFIVLLFFLTFFLVLAFMSINLLLFYIAFEGALIPMFLIIGIWGSRDRKVHAAYYLFFYTLISSIFLLVGIIYIFVIFGTLDIEYLKPAFYQVPHDKIFYTLWVLFFIPFAVKIPMYPFHLWLPEAHVEAPTPGSVVLAGILLKLGGFGLIRYNLYLFPHASIFFIPGVYALALTGIIFASCAALRQTDLKKIIAYSSVAHMNMVVLSIFSCSIFGLMGAVILMLAHGIVASALFILIGCLYARFGSRHVYYYSGLVATMPKLAFFFFIFAISNFAFPGTSNFAGEVLVFLCIWQYLGIGTFIALSATILCVVYTIYNFSRIFHGILPLAFPKHIDLTIEEVSILVILTIANFALGLFPGIIVQYLYVDCWTINNDIIRTTFVKDVMAQVQLEYPNEDIKPDNPVVEQKIQQVLRGQTFFFKA